MLICKVVTSGTKAVFGEEKLCSAVVLLEIGLIGFWGICVVVEQSVSDTRFMNDARGSASGA